jgi:L-fuconolactonase
MTIIDAHQHFWRLDRGDYGWLTPAVGPIYRDCLPEHLAPKLARTGVTATVLVQAAPTIAETRYLLRLAREHAFVAGVVGWADFESSAVADDIAELAASSKLVGLRPMIQDIPDVEWMMTPELAPAYEAMAEHGLVFDALVRPEHLPVLLRLHDRHPDLTMVLDHGAKPNLRGGDIADWKRDIAELAVSTNMVCKLSGLVTEAGSIERRALAPCVDHLLECFGPQRLMWGSDWPVCELVCSYEDWHATTGQLLASLSPEHRAMIFAETALTTYGI